MNILEQKCALFKSSPQNRWFELRYKPTLEIIFKMQDDNIINLQELNVPIFNMMNINTYVFKYDGEFYFLFITKIGNVFDFFRLERTNSSYGGLLTSHMVISSDDDPKQEMYIPSIAMCMGVKNTSELIGKLNSML